MSDLIRREDVNDLIKQICDACGEGEKYNGVMCRCCRFDDFIGVVDNIPSAEPERKKGEWKKIGNCGRHYRCDQCGNTLDFDGVNAGRGDANFCPNCGSKMTRGES